eukprot:scaffold13680_cov128-Isochrysis_galbana.AAC.5
MGAMAGTRPTLSRVRHDEILAPWANGIEVLYGSGVCGSGGGISNSGGYIGARGMLVGWTGRPMRWVREVDCGCQQSKGP